jgi:hypothetical protein
MPEPFDLPYAWKIKSLGKKWLAGHFSPTILTKRVKKLV